MLMPLLYLLIGLIGIGIIIFIHELGHFAAARLMKVDVEVLSFGFGPSLLSIHGRNTEYRISAVPFGGYCRMKGSLDLMKALRDDSRSMDRTEDGSYFGTTPHARFIIYLAGPLMNFIVASLLLALSASIPVARLSDPAVATPIADYPALFPEDVMQPGIAKGDHLISSDGHIFLDWQDAEDFIASRSGEEIPLVISRDGEMIESNLIPTWNGSSWVYGIANLQEPVIGRSLSEDFLPGDRVIEADGIPIEWTYDLYSLESASFELTILRNGKLLRRQIDDGILPFAWKSGIRMSRESGNPIIYGMTRALEMSAAALKAIGAFITFHLDEALTVITGPVKAAESIGGITALAFSESGRSGLRTLLMLLAMVSLSISTGNMLPVPTFDGGQMLMTVVEMFKGRPLSPRSYVILQIIGMVLALVIMVMMYSLDIKAYFFS